MEVVLSQDVFGFAQLSGVPGADISVTRSDFLVCLLDDDRTSSERDFQGAGRPWEFQKPENRNPQKALCFAVSFFSILGWPLRHNICLCVCVFSNRSEKEEKY